jgi:hypothetical protein
MITKNEKCRMEQEDIREKKRNKCCENVQQQILQLKRK